MFISNLAYSTSSIHKIYYKPEEVARIWSTKKQVFTWRILSI